MKEKVEANIIGKGYVRGRINVCLGKPADQALFWLSSWVLLLDWEMQRGSINIILSVGRLEFEKIKSKASRCTAPDEKELFGEKMEGIVFCTVTWDLPRTWTKWTSISRNDVLQRA